MPLLILSLLVASMLDALPMPDFLAVWRPPWVLLTILFWSLTVPDRMALWLVFVLGLVSDVLVVQPLGLNAGCYVAVCFVGRRYHVRWRGYPLLQQILAVLLLVGLVQVVRIAVWSLESSFGPRWLLLWGAVSAALAWPLIRTSLRWLRGWLDPTTT